MCDDVVALTDKYKAIIEHAHAMLDLLTEYPDIVELSDRWGNVRLASASANNMVDKTDIHHNCGCCTDSPLEVYPYTEIDGQQIYANPPCYTVGNRYWNGGDEPCSNWRDRLKHLPLTITEQVQEYFENHEPCYDD